MLAIIWLDHSPEVLASVFPQVSPPLPFPRLAVSSHGPCSAPGLVAVFDYHKKKGYADLYSLHSWCGISVFVLYFMQVSLVPASTDWERRGWDSGVPQRGPLARVHVQKRKEHC